MTARYHLHFPGALVEGAPLCEADARALALRIEPVRTVLGSEYRLDLTLRSRRGLTVVAGIELDRRSLALRDRSPYLLPAAAGACEAQVLRGLALSEPRLRERFTRSAEPVEELLLLEPAAAGEMHARRARGELGAAPYRAVLRARGHGADDGAYLETLLGQPVPPAPRRIVEAHGPADASSRSYLVLSDDALLGGAAARSARDVADLLASDGLRAEIGGYDGRPLDGYAAVHAFGLDDPHATRALFARARAAGLRTVITPAWDDPVSGAYWGAGAHANVLRLARDEAGLAGYRAMLRDRVLVFDDEIPPHAPWEPQPGFLAAARAALALADAVCVGAAGEAERLRVRFGLTGGFVPSVPLAREGEHGAAATLVCAAPLGPMHGSATLARAAARAGLPLRLCGPVHDGGYAAFARSYLDRDSGFADAPGWESAAVAVDVSWSGVDCGALADAAVRGIPLVVSMRSDAREIFGEQGVFMADPGDEDALVETLRAAWACAHRRDPALEALAAHARGRFRAAVAGACARMAYAPAAASPA